MMLLADIPPFSVTSVYSVRDKWPIGIKKDIDCFQKENSSVCYGQASTVGFFKPKTKYYKCNLNTKEPKKEVASATSPEKSY
jgi:hypothetical protein